MSDNNQTDGELARTIPPPLLAVYGLGTVLGAGIYVVIGEIIGKAEALAPFAFLVAALAAGLTAVSYAELAVRVPESGGSAAFVDRGFDRRWLTTLVGWAVVATGLVSAATIATGFVGYLGVFVETSKWWAVPALIGTLTAVAAIGVQQSAWFMGITTAAGVVGLVIVAVVAGGNLSDYPDALSQSLSSGDFGSMAKAVLLGSFLAFYAFIGFEDLATMTEEAKNPKLGLPLAIGVAVLGSLIFYLLTSAVALTTLDPSELGKADAPLVKVVEAEGFDGRILGGLSLAIIINGALAQIIMGARVIYDLGDRRDGAPSFLAKLNDRTKTPVLATLLCGAVVTALALFFPTETLAGWTSYIILGVFSASNAALIALKLGDDEPDDDVRTYPIAIPVAGLVVNIALIIGQAVLGGGGH